MLRAYTLIFKSGKVVGHEQIDSSRGTIILIRMRGQ